MTSLVRLSALWICSSLWVSAQPTFQSIKSAGDLSHLPRSNAVTGILIRNDTVWLATDKGLSFTADGGRNWTTLANASSVGDKAVSALLIKGDEIWVATQTSTMVDNDPTPVGAGLYHSSDRGKNWTFIPQPVDTGKIQILLYGANKIQAMAIPTAVQNVTYDFALLHGSIWIACWGGMLRKSDDNGASWQRVILPPDDLNHISPSDTLNFNLSNKQGKLDLGENLNHMMFSLCAVGDSTIWVGTAGGINKSVDGGVSWRKFNHQNQVHPICGNYVAAIRDQRIAGKTLLWALCNKASETDEQQGASYTDDGGENWKTIVFGEFVRAVAFKDSVVYIATDGGFYRTADFGKSMVKAGTIYDPITGQRFSDPRVFSVEVKGDTIWIAGGDGVAYTIDSSSEPFGSRWKIFRTYEPVQNSGKTYSFPLPFSPANQVVRLHYSTRGNSAPVTIRIFNFAMLPVRTLIRNAVRSGQVEHDEIWNGKDDQDRRTANGVYFYRVEIEGEDAIWGKIMVLQ
jgi:hypothetical protein